MKTPQPGIFNEQSQHFYILEYTLQNVQIADLKQSLSRALADPLPDVNIVVSFGKQAWSKCQPNWMPNSLEDFVPLLSPEGQIAPSTQGDIFFWLHGLDISETFDQAMSIHSVMKEVAHLTLEQRGFHYHQSFDLIGFEDGTANPKTDELKRDAAVIPIGQLGAGGSLVMSQKWLHDLDKWHHLPVSCQEKVVGRTKIENKELEGEAMPADSHISRTDLTVKNVPMKIYRRSSPYGTVTENGLFFLAFACHLVRFTSQLESMYGLTEDGTIDQLLNYSQAVSGAYWFAPSQEDLAEILKP